MCVLGTLTPAYLLDKLDRIFTPTSTASIAFALAVLFGFLQSLVFAHFTHGIISRYFSEDAPDAATDFKIHKVSTSDHAANTTLASLLVSVPLCPCGLSVVPVPLILLPPVCCLRALFRSHSSRTLWWWRSCSTLHCGHQP